MKSVFIFQCSVFSACLVLAACATPKPSSVDSVIAETSSSARAAYERGAYPQAAHFYERALQRARANDDGPEIARNGYNLAACYLLLNRAADARPVLQEALAEFGRARMDSHPALLLAARAAHADGQQDEARRFFDEAMTAAKSDAQRLQTWLAMGETACDAGDRAGAAAALAEAEKLRGKVKDPLLQAGRLNLSARVSDLYENYALAADEWAGAADAWKKNGRYREMAVALGGAADAYERSGNSRAAAERYFTAARSFFAQGDAVAALELIERGLPAGNDSGDEALQAQLAGLFEEITRAIKASK